MHEYWNEYDINKDWRSLTPVNHTHQSATGDGQLKAKATGYDPVWVLDNIGDRLKLLPDDLKDAVYEALRPEETSPFLTMYIARHSGGAILNNVWVQEAKVYLTELS